MAPIGGCRTGWLRLWHHTCISYGELMAHGRARISYEAQGYGTMHVFRMTSWHYGAAWMFMHVFCMTHRAKPANLYFVWRTPTRVTPIQFICARVTVLGLTLTGPLGLAPVRVKILSGLRSTYFV